jgi:hypothetical protein
VGCQFNCGIFNPIAIPLSISVSWVNSILFLHSPYSPCLLVLRHCGCNYQVIANWWCVGSETLTLELERRQICDNKLTSDSIDLQQCRILQIIDISSRMRAVTFPTHRQQLEARTSHIRDKAIIEWPRKALLISRRRTL